MPGIFPYAADSNPAFATGGAAGPASSRGQEAPLPPAQAPGYDWLLAGEADPGANRMESPNVGRMFS
jgi:hypothetical protein